MIGLAGLGRLPAPDDRDRKYLLPRAARRELEELPRRKIWYSPGIWDQGGSSQCVSYSANKWLWSGPAVNRRAPWSLEQFYVDCQRNDEWPGEEPSYFGTSVRAAFKVLHREGYVSEYRWGFDHPTVLRHVALVSPVVFGTDWHREMFMPDRWGYVHPEGPVEGGHAYLVIGADQDKVHPLTGERGAYRCINSWGAGWGPHGGRFWLAFSAADALINAYGEACTAMEIKR